MKPSKRIPCTECGTMILTTTAASTDGLCMSCRKKVARKAPSEKIAYTAFWVGLPSLLLAPFAVISGILYVLELIGIYKDPMGVPFDWGFGGVLYCLGIPVWLGYRWAARSERSLKELKVFWVFSLGLNAIWAIFFVFTSLRAEGPSLEREVWAACGAFPALLVFISYFGYLASVRSCRAPADPKPNKPSHRTAAAGEFRSEAETPAPHPPVDF